MDFVVFRPVFVMMARMLRHDLTQSYRLWVMFFITGTVLAAGDPFPDASQLPVQPGPPDPLIQLNGQRVTSDRRWYKNRRPELKALFQHYMYGYLPPAPPKVQATVERENRNLFGGKATLKEVTIVFGPPEAPCIHLLLVTPNAARKRAPIFLGLNFCGNHAVVDDPLVRLPTGWIYDAPTGVVNNRATAAGRGREINTWAIEQSIDRGYAVATFYNGDIDPDKPGSTDGVRAYYARRPAAGGVIPSSGRSDEWGTVAAWAWGLSRAVDYLVTNPDLDARHIAVVGHSRLGKAAMLAGAFDKRIALIIPLQAGCGGTAPSRGKIGESVKQINDRFPHWFNDEFKKFNDQVDRLPFDQHCLIALAAPRPVLLANATEDTWANPTGQFDMLKAADPVYRLLRAGGLAATQMPAPDKLIDSTLGYYIRPGKHSMTRQDWAAFLDFADHHFHRVRKS